MIIRRILPFFGGALMLSAFAAGTTAGCGQSGGGFVDAGGSDAPLVDGGDAGGACTVGQTKCTDATSQATCTTDSNGNPVWGTPSACSSGVCSAGACQMTFPDASEAGGPPIWTEYWVLGQIPAQTNVYVYARDGVNLTFSGTNSSPQTVTIPPDTFQSFNAGALGYGATGTQWYFLEATGDANFMMSADREVDLWSVFHGDQLHDKPGHGLSKTYDFAWAQSGPGDDEVVMYATQVTHVTAHVRTNGGVTASQSVTLQPGLYVSPIIATWFGIGDGYGLDISADQPIAAADFDEINDNTHPTSGYYFGNAGQTQLYDEYMHIHYSSVNTSAYHSFYVPNPSSVSYFAMDGTALTTKSYAAETSEIVYHQPLGYNISTPPYLVHYTATAGVADSYVTPTSTDVRAAASYMGWNASLAQLEIYAPTAANVEVYDGRDHTLRSTFAVAAGTIYTLVGLDTIGFTANQPFVAAVQSDVPVYQEIAIPDFLRQYPGDVGPKIN